MQGSHGTYCDRIQHMIYDRVSEKNGLACKETTAPAQTEIRLRLINHPYLLHHQLVLQNICGVVASKIHRSELLLVTVRIVKVTVLH